MLYSCAPKALNKSNSCSACMCFSSETSLILCCARHVTKPASGCGNAASYIKTAYILQYALEELRLQYTGLTTVVIPYLLLQSQVVCNRLLQSHNMGPVLELNRRSYCVQHVVTVSYILLPYHTCCNSCEFHMSVSCDHRSRCKLGLQT